MKKYLVSLLAGMFLVVGNAYSQQTYQYIIPTAPGTVSDLISRAIIDEYQKQTGNKIMLENIPGGDFIPAINRFKSCKTPCVIATGTAVQITNFLTKDNVPYSPEDFEHIAWIGWFPNILYVNAKSNIKSLDDLKKAMDSKQDITIAVSDTVNIVNMMAIHDRYKNQDTFREINYKTSTQGLTDVIGGNVTMGLVAAGSAIIGAAENGLIRIIGSTYPTPITIGNQTIQPIGALLKTETFQSSQTLSITPGPKSAEFSQLKQDLLKTVRSKTVSATLVKAHIIVDGGDGEYATRQLESERKRAAKFHDRLSKRMGK